ncbi:hypothetical protein [Nonomuraea sp. NPDC001023]|uniref:hypothetical protein n=1 Tax=unclassified Nonomuraea TaxID=2593643 RepID=UPI00332FF7CC
MTSNQQPRERLTALMEARRVALRLQWGEVAARAGMSTAHLRRIRGGEANLTPLMEAGLEEALQWAPGSIRHILAGRDPVETANVSSTASLALSATATARPAKPEAVERRYEDDAEQKIWEITELEPVIRKQLIALVRVTREAMAEEDRRPDADVREFRPRG